MKKRGSVLRSVLRFFRPIGGSAAISFVGSTSIPEGSSSVLSLSVPDDLTYDTFAEVLDADNKASVSGDEVPISGLDYEVKTSHVIQVSASASLYPAKPTLYQTITITVTNVAAVLSNVTDTKTGATTGTITVDTTEGNGTLYSVVTAYANNPTAAQIKAGLDHLGVAAAFANSVAVASTGTKTVLATGLVAGTQYYAHFVQTDGGGADSAVVAGDGFFTDGLFNPVDASVADLKALGAGLALLADSSGVQSGSSLTVNSQALGNYDYLVKVGNQAVSAFTDGAWFSATDDRAAAICVVGNLTINAGQVFKPAHRKAFTLIYVTGNLVLNGEISMSARGGNHSATGSNVSAAAIRIATGTFSAVVNPQVPAAGAAGAAAGSGDTTGNAGAAGAAGGTGGGGSGATWGFSGGTSGVGAAGSSFSGGPGSGGVNVITAISSAAGGSNGGAGSAAVAANSGNRAAGGGAGNPGGALAQFNASTGFVGSDGTGGVLVIICLGQFSGSGTVTGAGAAGGAATSGAGGGGSGGGAVTILYGTDTSSITPTALGGAGGLGNFSVGGAGGDGTARKLAL